MRIDTRPPQSSIHSTFFQCLLTITVGDSLIVHRAEINILQQWWFNSFLLNLYVFSHKWFKDEAMSKVHNEDLTACELDTEEEYCSGTIKHTAAEHFVNVYTIYYAQNTYCLLHYDLQHHCVAQSIKQTCMCPSIISWIIHDNKDPYVWTSKASTQCRCNWVVLKTTGLGTVLVSMSLHGVQVPFTLDHLTMTNQSKQVFGEPWSGLQERSKATKDWQAREGFQNAPHLPCEFVLDHHNHGKLFMTWNLCGMVVENRKVWPHPRDEND